MGYRDDTLALKSQIATQTQDNTKIEGQLRQLHQEGDTLARRLKRVRWRLRFLRLGSWAKRNPWTVIILVLVILIAGFLTIGPALKQARLQGTAKEPRRRQPPRTELAGDPRGYRAGPAA